MTSPSAIDVVTAADSDSAVAVSNFILFPVVQMSLSLTLL